jgi:Fic family protein
VIPEFYLKRRDWPSRIEEIVESVGRVSSLEDVASDTVELRRTNRIWSVHSSTAIEGNQLSAAQVESVAEGIPVFAAARDIREVENALAAYDAIKSLNPWDVSDFLDAHGLLTQGLVKESGAFRSVDVDIVNASGEVLHTGSRVAKVPRLISELFEWGSASADHPLIVSSAVHFLIEHIHPFRDGNGRIGRLWQTLILSRWRPIFEWIPVESLIRARQEGYYQALQNSREPEIDAGVFIDYMLNVIEEALKDYERRARSAVAVAVSGRSIPTSGPDHVFDLLAVEPNLGVSELADRLGKTSRTIERYLRSLKESGRIRRVGSPKSGHWEVV